MAFLLTLITILLILYLVYTFVYGKPENSPPGLIRLPIWGSYWLLLWGNYKFPHLNMNYYMKKYKSKVISCYLGDFFTVICNDYSSVKDVLTRKEFDGRLNELPVARARAFGKKLGIFFNDDIEWQEQRRFALRNMRDFGFGRRHNSLESNLADEINILISTVKNGPIYDFEKKVVDGNLVSFPSILFPACANAIWYIMTAERLDRTDHELLHKLCVSARRFQKGGDTTGGAMSITAWLKHFGNLFGYTDFIEGNQGIIDFIKRYIDQVDDEKLNSKDNEDNGFILRYLKEMKKLNKTNDNFNEEQLIMICVDFMFPALSAVPSVITHCIKYMIHYPEVLKRVVKELQSVVGTERLPNLDDRKNLPFTEATIREVMRIETLTPFSVAHRCLQTTKLQNYTIPAETIMITNLHGMHNDPDLWGDPENFRPDRFLTNDGQLGKDLSLPFGFGRRVCGGETFARFVILEIFSSLIQQFEFTSVAGQPTGLHDKIPGLIVQPKNVWIKTVARV